MHLKFSVNKVQLLQRVSYLDISIILVYLLLYLVPLCHSILQLHDQNTCDLLSELNEVQLL